MYIQLSESKDSGLVTVRRANAARRKRVSAQAISARAVRSFSRAPHAWWRAFAKERSAFGSAFATYLDVASQSSIRCASRTALIRAFLLGSIADSATSRR